jgi:hypothetical protein
MKISAAIDDAVKVLIRRFKRRRHCIGIKFSVKIDFARIGLLCLRTDIPLQAFLETGPTHVCLVAISLIAVFKEKGFAFSHHIPGKQPEKFIGLAV